ncbi:MAG: hypothetical protein V4616_01395 [Bacteroidota bacterium]
MKTPKLILGLLLLSVTSLGQVTLPVLSKFQKLEVTTQSRFAGEVIFENGLNLKGDARFQNTIEAGGALRVAGQLQLSGLTSVSAGERAIGVDALGNIKLLDLPGVFPSTACLSDLNGNIVERPASWQTNGNKLFVDLCATTARVGIGTDNPQAQFHVTGSALTAQLTVGGTSSDASFPLVVAGNTLVKGNNNFGTNAIMHLGDVNHYIKSTKGSGVTIGTFGGHLLHLSQTGKLGLGTNAPTAYLHIKATGATGTENLIFVESGSGHKFLVNNEGRAFANELNIKLGTFPDYVFEPSYDLMSLADLDQFISNNHHLPKLPTAEQVAENGADIGELNRLLVEKVEELTLHLIKMEQRIKELEKTNK